MTTHRPSAEVSTSSMADIAFLLLTFFLVTTVIENHKGIPMILPQVLEEGHPPLPWKERNLFTVQINSHNQFLVEGEPRENLNGVREQIKKFILNYGANETLSENPEKALVSLKTDRGTSYQSFIAALDEIQGAYYEIYGERIGVSSEAYRKLDLNNPTHQQLHKKAKEGMPMNISIAEPSRISDQ
jgi:biopolymer transport protein ExbD